jgi:putative addiction module component (TIGR02574 family)
MSTVINSLGLDRLPRADRLALVQELWDSIAAEGPPPLTTAQRQENRTARRRGRREPGRRDPVGAGESADG